MLINESKKQALDTHGFVVIDFADKQACHQILEVYKMHQSEIEAHTTNGIHMTNWLPNTSNKLKIKAKLTATFAPLLHKHFEHFKHLNEVFIVKYKHNVSNFPFHQDWSFVDETKHNSYNVWLALQDTNVKNGGLYVIPKSHKINNPIRGAGKLSFDFSQQEQLLKKYAIPIELKAGQAILFKHATIHGSLANKTKQPRIIAATSVISKDSPIIIHQLDANNCLNSYLMEDNDFAYKYNDIKTESISQIPNGKLLESIENYVPFAISATELEQLLVAWNGKPTSSFFDKLLSNFKF